MTSSEMTSKKGADAADQRSGMSYWRLGGMIATSVVVMYLGMYIDTYALSHITWSESRMYMAITMGGLMVVIMLAWMLKMYTDRTVNVAIFVAATVVTITSITLDRSQATIDDESFMSAMIPHHSMAILRAESAGISDVRVCQLTVAISEAQRREIAEMQWLLADIRGSGPAETVEEARARPVPAFPATAERSCPAE